MKKGCKVFFAGLIMLLLAGQAQAVTFDTVNDLFGKQLFLDNTEKMSTTLSGLFDFVYLGFEAGDTNVLLKTADDSIIFKNKGDGASSLLATATGYDISSLFLKDNTKDSPEYAITSWSKAVNIYQILNPITVNGYTLLSGMFIFGFDDSGSGDGDFDDLVFAGSQVPIPGAVWLLGSALVGMVGMRRKFVA
jgi:hypothetical protein